MPLSYSSPKLSNKYTSSLDTIITLLFTLQSLQLHYLQPNQMRNSTQDSHQVEMALVSPGYPAESNIILESWKGLGWKGP